MSTDKLLIFQQYGILSVRIELIGVTSLEWIKIGLSLMGGGLMLIIGYVTYLYKNNVRSKEKEVEQLKTDLEQAEKRSKERDDKLGDRQDELREKVIRLESTSVTREELDNLLDNKFNRFESRILQYLERMTGDRRSGSDRRD
ncbi:hypothetical protein VP249E411_P0019 [Vibrio phage 249E41-1]|nr:hypothetical protein VP249E411_P0019 [Vibrio phage 249E41-1]CAH9011933.1 hypothetical protein VP277E431_P0016 [Vibrio phage 277E43-1]CAH9011954.1 hypothetical protein VP495E541_P0023 [Vibrio phage 495E54-1]CAH9012032.1 hypothetical protein VP496E541_P0023 [Vibrio phage 496E54-1]CAH9015963.1 hypothetical protein VP193E371_P0019 [Vibrio phage 193E37-1]